MQTTPAQQRGGGRFLPQLRHYRDRRALTQLELAEAAGLTPATISRLEHQHKTAWPKTVRTLARVLGVTPAALYGEGE